MGITVISALPGNALPAIAPAGGAADTDANGGFAALLSGELLGQMGIVAELGSLFADQASAEDKPALKDKPALGDNPDAALLASLFGHPAGVDFSPRSKIGRAHV